MPETTNEVLEDVGRLHTALLERNQVAKLLDDYYRGNHPMPWAHAKAKKRYRELLRQATSNFPALVVDSLNDRLSVTGFRVDSDEADSDAWNLWQRNNLDMFAPLVHSQALVTGYSYVSVWPDDREGRRVRAESCFEVIHESEPGEPMNLRRGMKAWPNKFDKKWYARYFADGVYWKLEAPLEPAQLVNENRPAREQWATPTKWEVVDASEADCPFIPFLNRADLDGLAWGEFEDVLPIIDRINTLQAQLLLAGEFTAFRVRYATGIDIPSDDEGNPTEPFDVAMDRLWTSENPDAKFGTMEATDLKPYRDAVDQTIQHLAAITRTPPFMLLGNLTNLSAEALKATESGHVKKAVQRQVSFGESWEQVMRLALGTEAPDMETIWSDPENVSESQHVDALSKLYAMGLPQKAVWEAWGATPQQIERWDAMRSEDVMQRVMLQGASSPAPGLTPTPDAGPTGSTVQGGTGAAALAQTPDSGPAQ
jgi:hypothetical protein